MQVIKTEFPGLFILEPRVFKDKRGYFFESYNKNLFETNQVFYNFVQDNQSKSSYGVIRGLHYQIEPFAQTKLIRVFSGKIFDVVVDLRKNSPTYKKHFSIELTDENQKQFLIPKGFAHGFSVLSETAVVFYKCDEFYNPQSERSILYNDPELNIDWKIEREKQIVSDKDMKNPLFKDAYKFEN